MKSGLLWYDDDPRRGLVEKVLRAAVRYRRKYGRAPNLCFAHPSAFGDNGHGKPVKVSGMEIRSARSVLPHHFWLGIDDDKGTPARAHRRSLSGRAQAPEAKKEPLSPGQARQLAMALGLLE